MRATILDIGRVSSHVMCVLAVLIMSSWTPDQGSSCHKADLESIEYVDLDGESEEDPTNQKNTQNMSEEHDDTGNPLIGLGMDVEFHLKADVVAGLLSFHASDLSLFTPPPEGYPFS